MEEHDQDESSCQCSYTPPVGVPMSFSAFALAVGLIGGAIAGYQFQRPAIDIVAQANQASITAQANASAENFKAQAAFQKRIADVQQKVADACVAHGGIPVYNQQNVDCKTK